MKRTDTQTLINLLRLVSNETEGASAIVREAADRLEELHKALQDIVKHQEIVAGELAKFTAAWKIATQALDGA